MSVAAMITAGRAVLEPSGGESCHDRARRRLAPAGGALACSRCPAARRPDFRPGSGLQARGSLPRAGPGSVTAGPGANIDYD